MPHIHQVYLRWILAIAAAYILHEQPVAIMVSRSIFRVDISLYVCIYIYL